MLRAAPGRVLAISGGSVNVFGGSVVGGGLVRLGFLTGAIASTGLAVDPDATLAITGSTVNGPGALSIAAGATLVGENSGTFNSAVSNNGGTILVRGSLTLAGDTTATAGSVLRVQGNAAFGSAVATVAGFANNGLIELTSENGFNATLTVSGGTLANAAAATIAAEAGASGGGRTVNLNGGQLTNAGTISASGADLSVNSAAGSAIHNTGVASSSAGRTLTYTGGVTSNFGGSIVGDGMVRFSNSTISLPTSGLTVGTSSTLALTSCTVNGPGGLSLTAGSTLVGENSATVNTAVTSNGATILVRSFLTLSGDTTTNANSILRVQGNAGFGSATAVVAGFTNEGLIELTSENGSNATLTVSAGTLVNAGTGFVRSTIGDSGGRTINLTNGSRLSNLGTISAAGAGLALNLSGAGATVTNSGTFSTAPGRTLSLSGGTFSNFSANTLTDGTYDIAGTFQFPGAAINTLAANLILTGTGSAILNSTNGANALAGCNVIGAAGQLVLAGFRNFTAAGAFSNSGTLLVNAGSTFVASGLTNAAGGTLAGNGTIALSLAGAGTVSPGTSPGTLTVVGTASLSGPLAIELNGTAPGTGYDQLVVNGTVNLSGATLDVTRNFVSQPGDSFVIVANDGTDAVSGTFAGLPEGATTTICGPQFRISYVGDTGNDIVLTQLTAGAPARVADVEVNAGQANQLQRSRVTTITVTFDQTVTFVNPGDVAAAFGLSRIGGGAVGGFTATVNVQGGVTVVTLSGFTGAESDFGSLADGRYSLTVRASQVVGLDGDGNGTPGDDYALAGTVANGLFRLFGDAEGNGVVNAFDYAQFRPTFGSSTGQAAYLDWLDFNGDGTINAFDFGQFRNRFGAGVP